MNAATSQGLSGAASGAVTGAAVGSVVPGIGTAIGAVAGGLIGGIAGMFSGGAADAAQKRQLAWAKYNAALNRTTDYANLNLQALLSQFNAESVLGRVGVQAALIDQSTNYNLSLLNATTKYNDELLYADILNIFNQLGLDEAMVVRRRQIERGEITARQAASGTIINSGSNADVLMYSVTQQAIEQFILERNADAAAEKINNARAKGLWEAQVTADQIAWQGDVQKFTLRENANRMADSIQTEAYLRMTGGMFSAENRYYSSMMGVQHARSQYQLQNSQNLANGLFSAATRAGSMYFKANGGFDTGDNGTFLTPSGSTSAAQGSAFPQTGFPGI